MEEQSTGSAASNQAGSKARVQLKVAGLGSFLKRYGVQVVQGNLFVKTAKPLSLGREVALRVVGPDGNVVFDASAFVGSTRPARQGASLPPGMGLIFSEHTPASQQLLERIQHQHEIGGSLEAVALEIEQGLSPGVETVDTSAGITEPTPAQPEDAGLESLFAEAPNSEELSPSPATGSPTSVEDFAASVLGGGGSPAQSPDDLAAIEDALRGEEGSPTVDSGGPSSEDLSGSSPSAGSMEADDLSLDELMMSMEGEEGIDEAIVDAPDLEGDVAPAVGLDSTEDLAGLYPVVKAGAEADAVTDPTPFLDAFSGQEENPMGLGFMNAEDLQGMGSPGENMIGETLGGSLGADPGMIGSERPVVSLVGTPKAQESVPELSLESLLTDPVVAMKYRKAQSSTVVGAHTLPMDGEPPSEEEGPVPTLSVADAGGPSTSYGVHHETKPMPTVDPTAAMAAGAALLENAPHDSRGVDEVAPSKPLEPEIPVSDLILGIDIGSDFTRGAFMKKRTPVMVSQGRGENKELASAVWLGKGPVCVGSEARELLDDQPQNTVIGIKGLLGQKFLSKEVTEIQDQFGFDLVSDEMGDTAVEIGGQVYPMQWIAAQLLAELGHGARKVSGENIRRAVLAVPPIYNFFQRRGLLQAAARAGFDVIRMISEPLAVVSSKKQGWFSRNRRQLNMVYVLDESGFHVSLVRSEKNKVEMVATHGSKQLSGYSLDRRVAGRLLDEFAGELDGEYTWDPTSRARVCQAVTAARHTLMKRKTVPLRVPAVATSEQGLHDLDVTLSRDQLIEWMGEDLAQTLELFQKTLTQGQSSVSDLDEVFFGGSLGKTPWVQDRVASFLEKKTKKTVIGPGAVAQGAAGLAQRLVAGDGFQLVDVASLPIGLALPSGRLKLAMERNTPLPHQETVTLGTAKDQQTFFSVDVYQGEMERVHANDYLGTLEVAGLKACPRGELKMAFHFDLDEQGMLEISISDSEDSRTRVVGLIPCDRPLSLADQIETEGDGGSESTPLGSIYTQ